jgi:haloacid dehalogenase-like hydrolase
MPYVTFDVDGVLFDTKTSVYESYLQAGVEMPESAWGKRWQDWLPELCKKPEEVHDKKNLIYPTILKELGRPLPGAYCLDFLKRMEINVCVVTSASREAAKLITNLIDVQVPIFASCLSKKSTLKLIAPTGVHIDDFQVIVPDEWLLIHYTTQTSEELEDQVLNEIFKET